MAKTLHYNFATDRSLTARAGPTLGISRASDATYWDSAGVLQTVGSNVARFDHDPVTLASLGLLSEPAATNLVRYSQDLSQALWAKTNCTVASVAGVGPDGGAAYKVTPSAISSSAHYVGITITVAAGKTTHSCLVKPDGMDNFFFGLGGGPYAGECAALFDCSAESVLDTDNGTTATVDRTAITLLSNGWYLLEVEATGTAGGAQPRLGFTTATSLRAASDGYPAYTPNGTDGGYITAIQSESGSVRTSYIPTLAGATVTRAADDVSSSDVSWYNETEGTLYASCYQTRPAADTDIININDGTQNNRVKLGTTDVASANLSNLLVSVGGVGQVDLREDTVTADGVLNRIAAAYKVNDFELYTNNSRSGTGDQVGSVPTGITTLQVGGRGGVLQYHGWIAEIAYYNERLDNTVLDEYSTNGIPSATITGILYPRDSMPTDEARFQTFIDDSGITQTGDLSRDYRAALHSVLGLSGNDIDYDLPDLFKRYYDSL